MFFESLFKVPYLTIISHDFTVETLYFLSLTDLLIFWQKRSTQWEMFWKKDVLRIFVKYLQRNSYFKALQGQSHNFTKNEIIHRSFLMNFFELYLIVYRILRIQEHLFPDYLSMATSSKSWKSCYWGFRTITSPVTLIRTTNRATCPPTSK